MYDLRNYKTEAYLESLYGRLDGLELPSQATYIHLHNTKK